MSKDLSRFMPLVQRWRTSLKVSVRGRMQVDQWHVRGKQRRKHALKDSIGSKTSS